MTRLLKEPLLHFLLLGAALFGLSAWVSPDEEIRNSSDQIVVSSGRIEQLAKVFEKTWQRPPSPAELRGLVEDFVLEEVYYRQAIELGIDRDDVMIRRRLRQKLEFLTDDAAVLVEPSDDELEAFLQDNASRFRRGNTYTFQQVYCSPDQHGGNLEEHVAAQLRKLRAGEEVMGDSRLLSPVFEHASGALVDRRFGAGFSAQLDTLPLGTWQGPIGSGLGLHLVRVDSRTEGTLPDLERVREKVEREWENARRLEARDNVNTKLREQYEVTIEWPETPDPNTSSEP